MTSLVPRLGSHLRRVLEAAVNHDGQRSVIMRSYLFDVGRQLSPLIAVERNHIRYLVSGADRGLGRQVFSQGSHEEGLLGHAVHLASRHSSGRTLAGRTFVDVGANIGTVTVPAIKVFEASRAIAIEPSPESFRLLRCNAILNEVDAKVSALELALSDANGSASFELATSDWGDHRVRVDVNGGSDFFEEGSRRTISVKTARLDDVLAEASVTPDDLGLVWIDAQGHEAQILLGAPNVLASATPVVIEYWPYGLRRAGGLAALHDLVADNFTTVVDLHASMEGKESPEMAAGAMGELEGRFPALAFTDLLLLG